MTDDKEKVSCTECFFIEAGEIDPNNVTSRQYFCKRLPPVPIVMPGPPQGGQLSVQIRSVFPMTTPEEWCGEWADEFEDTDQPGEISQSNTDDKTA